MEAAGTSMPGTGLTMKLLVDSVAGCMGNLYGSAEKLDDAYVLPGGAAKGDVLCAAVPSPAAAGPNSYLLRLPEPPAAPAPGPKKLFNCGTSSYSSCRGYVTEVRGSRCPNCNSQMLVDARLIASSPEAPAAAKKGFVQGGIATYTVTDDLAITPMSNVSSIALLNACAVRDLGALQERTVQIGYKEGLEILRASLQSKTVLTDVFLGKKPPSPKKDGNGTVHSVSNGRRREALAWRV